MLSPAFYAIIFHPTECSKTVFVQARFTRIFEFIHCHGQTSSCSSRYNIKYTALSLPPWPPPTVIPLAARFSYMTSFSPLSNLTNENWTSSWCYELSLAFFISLPKLVSFLIIWWRHTMTLHKISNLVITFHIIHSLSMFFCCFSSQSSFSVSHSFTITSKVCNDAHIYNKSNPKPSTKAQVKVKTQNHTSHQISRTSAGKTKSKRRMVKPGSSTSTHNKRGLVKPPSLFKWFFHTLSLFSSYRFSKRWLHTLTKGFIWARKGKRKRKSKGREKKE